MLPGLIITAVGALLGVAGGALWVSMQRRGRLDAARAESVRIRQRAEAEAEAQRREAEARARQEALTLRQRHQQVVDDEEDRLGVREADMAGWADTVAADMAEMDAIHGVLDERVTSAKNGLERARATRSQTKEYHTRARNKLREVAEQSAEDCLAELLTLMVDDVRAEASDRLRNIEAESSAEAPREAERVIATAMGRLALKNNPERHMSNVQPGPKQLEWLLSEASEPVRHIIEEGTGVKLTWINDDTVLRMESGNSLARVTASRVLERVLRDGEPTIEDAQQVLAETQRKLHNDVMARGRQAFKQLRLRPAEDEVTELLGRLYYRTSYSQNQWEHVIEAARLGGLMAAELGLDVKLATRATLLHDIGKALTPEIEGSHALIGGEIAERCGEPPEVVGSINEHHDEQPVSSIYTLITIAADAISGARPGARRELVETYGERIDELERLASRFKGVDVAHAVQAGREVRVHVDETRMNDDQAADLASEIAQKISDELTFPGQIQVTVIREFAAVETAN